MKKILLYSTFITFGFVCKAQTISDVDGNIYNAVTIGTQIWMKENLRTTKYNDGTAIPEVTDSADWSMLNTDGYCWYNGDAATYKSDYGALYNRYTVNTRKLCPSGWHVPTTDEWITLTEYLGGDSLAGGKLKETGTAHWINPNTGATNQSEFTALPGGIRLGNGSFRDIGILGTWISDTVNNHTFYWYRLVNSLVNSIYGGDKGIGAGFSVRCLKNSNSSSVNLLDFPTKNLIYPNPASDKLYINDNKFLNCTIIIFDLQGKKVINKQIKSTYIDISNLTKGIYLIKIINNENIISDKFIKE